MACNSLWAKECDTAVVGGMNILSSSDNYVGLSSGHFLSPTGGCKTFDQAADGYCRGEAVASVVLKRLDAAQADNDNILSVILSASTNYSAYSDSITRPHAPSQESLYRTVLRDAGITALDVDYVEMHGTGTQAGDTIEMTSVSNVFAPAFPARPSDNPLYVGAIKSNVGHGESASGITGLIKTMLMMREQELPPHVGIKTTLNSKFPDLKRRNIHIPFDTTPMPSKHGKGLKRRALINNFSAAGGNTACILEEPPKRPTIPNLDTRSHHIVAVSAKSKISLAKNAENLLTYMKKNPTASLSDLSYTTMARRRHHPYRQAWVATSLAELEVSLSSFIKSPQSTPSRITPKLSICFTGQGSFYMSLGKGLFDSSHHFKTTVSQLNRMATSHNFASFLPVITGSEFTSNSVSQVQIHLAIVAIQMALLSFFESLGLRPQLVIGHSLGEFAALHGSGILSASDTLYLVGQRATLMENLCQPGTHAMLAIQADETTICQQITLDQLEIACINGPNDTVLSGPVSACRETEHRLKAAGIKSHILAIPFAFHSAQMDPILDALEHAASSVHFSAPTIPLASPSTGQVIKESGAVNATYIRNHTRNTVRFSDALNRCQEEGLVADCNAWLEIGPRPLCMNMIQSTLSTDQRLVYSLRENESPWASIGKTLASLHNWGYAIDWQDYHRDFESGQRLLSLPKYGWEEKDYWIPYRNDWLLRKGVAEEMSEPPAVPEGPNTTSVQRLISTDTTETHVQMIFESDLTDPEFHSTIIGHVINGSALLSAVSTPKLRLEFMTNRVLVCLRGHRAHYCSLFAV
jgi:acyl transferase domain-containing protein